MTSGSISFTSLVCIGSNTVQLTYKLSTHTHTHHQWALSTDWTTDSLWHQQQEQ